MSPRDIPQVTREFAARMAKALPSSTLAITAKAKELARQGKNVISLAAGEPDFPVPTPVQEAIVAALKAGDTRYTPTSGLPELKQAVCDKILRDQKLQCDPSMVVVSCGAKHSLYNIFQALLNPGDEVLIPVPYWVSYPDMAHLAGATPKLVDTFDSKFVLTRKAIEKVATPKSKLLVLNSPSNPTGAIIPHEELKAIADWAMQRDITIVSDEIYEYYTFDGNRHETIASLIPDWKSRVLIVNGLSKSHSMTGLRIGFTIGDPEVIKKIGILQDHSTSNPVSLSQRGAIAALKMDLSHADFLRSTFEKRRNLLFDGLSAIPGLKPFKAPGAFYTFVSVKDTGISAQEFSTRLLEEAFVATIPGEGFGAPGYVRMSFAASDDNIREAIQRIKSWLSKKG